ncbi:hypothetical protein N2152v2_004176 [Parachlorella kessleri]
MGASWLQQFTDLTPKGKLDAFELLTAYSSLVQMAEASPQDAAAQSAIQLLAVQQKQTQRQLYALLPALEGASLDGAASTALKEQAAEVLLDQLATTPPNQQRKPARLAWALVLVNTAWFCGCILLVLAALALVGRYLAVLMVLVPLPAWEVIGYTASGLVLRAALVQSSQSTAPYVALTGLLLLSGCMGGTIALHGLKDRVLARPEPVLGVLAALFGAVAIRLQATLLGTLAVWLGVSALGFTIIAMPFLTVIGFRNGMVAPFSASLLLILTFLPSKVAPEALPMPKALQPFQQGVWLWCVLVVNVVNLIMFHRTWEKGTRIPTEVWDQIPWLMKLRIFVRLALKRLAEEVPAVAVIASTLACGVALDIDPCRAIGAVFGLLWFLSMLAQIGWHRIGIAWGALLCGGLVWGLSYAAHAWAYQSMQAADQGL